MQDTMGAADQQVGGSSPDKARQYCRVVDWTSLGLMLIAVLAGGLYGIWILGSVNLGFIAFIVAIVVVIGGAAFLLKVCIRRAT